MVALFLSEALSMCKYAILRDAKLTSCQSVNSMPDWALIFFKYNITSSGKKLTGTEGMEMNGFVSDVEVK